MRKLILIILFLLPSSLHAQEYSYPFIAKAANENVNVRSGQSRNFEKLYQLNQDEEVIVLGKEYSWYKIQLPAQARSYVTEKYIKIVGKNTGEVVGHRVNVRSGPGIHFTALAQLEEGEKVTLIDLKDEWYKIAPPKDTVGWIRDDLIVFSSYDVPQEKTSEVVLEKIFEAPVVQEETKIPEVALKTQESGSEENQAVMTQAVVKTVSKSDNVEEAQKTAPEPQKVQPQHQQVNQQASHKRVSIAGTLLPVRFPKEEDIQHKLIINGQTAYYLKGNQQQLKKYVYYEVMVKGSVIEADGAYSLPVIDVSKLKLIY